MSTLGPYELVGELGRGAMAVVWRAFDPRLEREVAIKEPVIPHGTDSAAAAELGARFVREGKAAAKLNHPGIVTIHAADIYEGRPAIVMELIEGETLADILARGALPPGAAVAILDQLLDAVAFAHERGVVHRDIKPDNVFVTSDGRVKLADFGIAHVGSTATLTQAGTVMGTPGYMAPEQVTGQPVDARADVFAIGAIAYEMLTGANPFGATQGDASTTVMYRIVHEDPPAIPEQAFAGLPVSLAPVIAAALAKNPQARIADARTFRAALSGGPILTGAQAGMSAPAAPQAGLPTVSPWTAQQQAASAIPKPKPTWIPYAAAAAIAGVVLVAVFAFGGGVPGGAVPAAAPATEAAPEPEEEAEEAPEEVVDPGPTEEESRGLLAEHYDRIGGFGHAKSGEIAALAKRFNNDPLDTTGATDGTTRAAEDLVGRIDSARMELDSMEVAPSLQGVKDDQLELYGYCIIRAQAIVDACYISQSGGDIKPPLDEGRAAKESYLELYPHAEP